MSPDKATRGGFGFRGLLLRGAHVTRACSCASLLRRFPPSSGKVLLFRSK